MRRYGIFRQHNFTPPMTDTAPQNYICTTAPGVLHNALLAYQSDGDKEKLREVLNNHTPSRRVGLIAPLQRESIARRVFASFTFFPSNDYQYAITQHVPQTIAEAIGSYWQATGEYLSGAMIRHIVNDKSGNGEA